MEIDSDELDVEIEAAVETHEERLADETGHNREGHDYE